MPLFNVRELTSFPPGSNSTDTVINKVHFNRTALDLFNYTLYSNNTLSNQSNCWLTFDLFHPFMLYNGTFINATSCYSPIHSIRARGSIGILFACLFGASILLTLFNLRKHGRLFLPSEKRFRAVGRRWQWYWMLFVAACGMISGFTGIDVDRDYLQSTAIILQSFFGTLMMPGILATVWEAVRHWGSWQERQIYDHDPFSLPQDDSRGRLEFYLPLIFYLFAWLNFFMIIPRPWTAVQYQRSPEQARALARPSSTDARLKAGGLLAFLAWCTICYSLRHSIHHYKRRNRGSWNSFRGLLQYCPWKFQLAIPLLLLKIAYAIASSFVWTISPFKFDGNAAWLYGLGIAPAFLIILIFEICGFLEPDEDHALLQQRVERGRVTDSALGIRQKKPNWWSKLPRDQHWTNEQRLRALPTEIGGGRPTTRNMERNIELSSYASAEQQQQQQQQRAQVEDPFRDDAFTPKRDPDSDPDPDPNGDESLPRAPSLTPSSSVSSPSPPQPQQHQIRSMLDV